MSVASSSPLPEGTISFLFTDIEGSTRLVEALGEAWVAALQTHNSILQEAVAVWGGFPIKTEGDSLFAVFASPPDAVSAAVDAQKSLASAPWPEGHDVRVRMGVHTGEAILLGSDYVGLEVHRAARISDAAHGGQIVISEPTAIGVERELPDGASLNDLGKFRLKDLSDPETLFQVSVMGLNTEFPPLRTLDVIPNNLPPQLTSFVGRDQELAAALDLLERTRILTLTGPGGTGKTRLSLQIAAEASHRFDDGVFFVDLSPINDIEVVPTAILGALGMSASGREGTPLERLLSQTASMSVLMVLDNFEQLLDAAPMVSEMVKASPRCKFVVTSRAPLRIRGEQEMPVPPLATGGAASVEEALEMEGVHLFVERATSVRPDFRVTRENLFAITELVEHLDGLPLAIELVASRLRLFGVEQIAERLDARMLSAGSVDVPERQRTITNAIDWSYQLLPDHVKTLFSRLSVFAGGARLEEIEALCIAWDMDHDLLDGLGALVDHSLLRSGSKLGMPRFRMLHVIREYASSKLDERPEDAEMSRRAHLRLYGDLVETARPQLLKREREHWLDVLEADHDNIRSALDWGVTAGETELVQRLASGTWRFWQARGYLYEADEWLVKALDMAGGTDAGRAKAIEALAGVRWWRGRMDDCLDLYEQALTMQRALGDDREIANALYNYGLTVAFHLEEFDRGRALMEQAREIYLGLDDADGLGDVAWGLGNTFLFEEDGEHLLPWFEEAAKHYRRAGNEFGYGWARYEAGAFFVRHGDLSEAWSRLKEAMALFASHRDISGVVLVGSELAGLALKLGDPHRAYRLARMAFTWRDKSGTDISSLEFNTHEGLEPDTLAALKGNDLAAFESGADASVEEMVAYALAGPTDDRG